MQGHQQQHGMMVGQQPTHMVAPQQPVIVYLPQETAGRPKWARPPIKYTEKQRLSARRLSIVQLTIAIAIIILHSATTGLNDHYKAEKNRAFVRSYSFYDRTNFTDYAATGIWVGIFFLVSGIIGTCAGQKNTAGLITTHLVLNVFNFLFSWVLIGTVAGTVAALHDCFTRGSGSYYADGTTEFFGERIGRSWNSFGTAYFRCKHPMFKAWMGLDITILILACFSLIFNFVLMVFNSMAACKCCQCCYSNAATAGTSNQVVAARPSYSVVYQPSAPYQPQPQNTMPQPVMAPAYSATQNPYPTQQGFTVPGPAPASSYAPVHEAAPPAEQRKEDVPPAYNELA